MDSDPDFARAVFKFATHPFRRCLKSPDTPAPTLLARDEGLARSRRYQLRRTPPELWFDGHDEVGFEPNPFSQSSACCSSENVWTVAPRFLAN
jgi:hypothetical protein